MQAHLRLGRLCGVEIGLHDSWFLIALLIMLSLGGHCSATHPEWGAGVRWTLAILTGLLFFAALLAHELSHAAVAKARGLPVRAITLFALGGVAHIEQEAADPLTECAMGLVGPVTSALIGGLCFSLAWALGSGPPWAPRRHR